MVADLLPVLLFSLLSHCLVVGAGAFILPGTRACGGLEADVEGQASVSQPVSKCSDRPDPGRGWGGKEGERRRGSKREGAREGLRGNHLPKGNAQ